MAYELNTDYQTPSGICWLKRLGEKRYDYTDVYPEIEVKPTVAPFRIAWRSFHGNFQVQYCVRRRQAPYYASQQSGTVTYTDEDTGETYSVAAYDGEEVWVPWTGRLGDGHASTSSEATWTDSAGRTWGPWQGNALSSSNPKPSGVELLTKTQIEGWRTYDLDMPFAYELAYGGSVGIYDRCEYRVRVRAFNATQNDSHKWNYGRWGEAVLAVGYMPLVTSMEGERNEDGSVTVHVESNWQHSSEFAAVSPLDADLNVIQPDTYFADWADPDIDDSGMGDFTFDVPENYAPDEGHVRFSYMNYFPDDTALSHFETYGSYMHETDSNAHGFYVEVPIVEHVNPSTVSAPTVTIDASGNVTVAPQSGEYANVLTRLYWIDGDGKSNLVNVSMKESSDGTWKGKVSAPPIGTDIQVRTTVVDGEGDWRTDKTVKRVSTNAQFMLDGTGVHFELRYNVEFEESAERQVEYVITDGRDREVSRYARATVVTHTVEGDVINPATGYHAGDAWKKEVDQLKSCPDLWMRATGGIRRRVSVESVSTSSEYPNNARFMHVTIQMHEVA